MITRRGFLARLAAAPIVALALPKAPVADPEVAPLAFHPDAFKMVMGPLTDDEMIQRYIEPSAKAIWDEYDRRMAPYAYWPAK